MLNVVMLNVVMLKVVMLNVFMQSVLAPFMKTEKSGKKWCSGAMLGS
jgi:hypothetical protein